MSEQTWEQPTWNAVPRGIISGGGRMSYLNIEQATAAVKAQIENSDGMMVLSAGFEYIPMEQPPADRSWLKTESLGGAAPVWLIPIGIALVVAAVLLLAWVSVWGWA